jgi:polar amino acid transport system substrate-binding protein
MTQMQSNDPKGITSQEHWLPQINRDTIEWRTAFTAEHSKEHSIVSLICRIRYSTIAAALALTAIAPAASWANDLKDSVVHICEDGGEWPPYTYYHRINGKPTQLIRGYAVDVVDAIFAKAGITHTIELLPWARCQKEVEQGVAYQMALNASWNETRAKAYFLSRPYYRTTNYYFYSRRHHPDGLPIAGVDDLKKFRVCGLFGYNYETYGLAPGSVDQGTRDFAALIAKLHAGRCDLFLEKYEIMAGFTAIGQPYLADKDLAGMPVPGMASTQFYIMISRRHEHGEQLIKLVNDGLNEMESSKQLDKLLRKYVP